MTLDVLGVAPSLAQTPLLVVHGRRDAYCAQEFAEEPHCRATELNEFVWIHTERHIGLYYRESHVTQAVNAVSADLLSAGARPGRERAGR